MRQSKKFQAFGVNYSTKQFSAVRGIELVEGKEDNHPCEILALTSVVLPDGRSVQLDVPEAINEHILDVAFVLPPRLVLAGVISVVYEFNFSFIETWSPAKVPSRFRDGTNSVSSTNVDPMISQLMQDGVADLQKLEEYYSLEDAFKMFDSIMVRGINQALSHEASIKKSKRP